MKNKNYPKPKAKPINIRLTGLSAQSGVTLKDDLITANIEITLMIKIKDAVKVMEKSNLTISELNRIIKNRE